MVGHLERILRPFFIVFFKVLLKLPGHRKLMWPLAKRFIAGETLEEAIKKAKELSDKGFKITLAYIGENQKGIQVIETEKMYIALLDAINKINKENLSADIALKITQFNCQSPDVNGYMLLLRRVIKRASHYRILVWFDAEKLEHRARMASLAIKFAGEFNNIGIAIQAYAKDAIPFLNSIAPLCKHNSSVAIRVCKGAYHESKKKVFRKERDIFLNFRRLVSRLVNYDFFLQFATHDPSLMASSVGLAVKHGKQETDYEAGMLLGVEEEAAAKLLASGVSVRIYCAFGKPWDEFVARRVIEKPRYIKYIFKR